MQKSTKRKNFIIAGALAIAGSFALALAPAYAMVDAGSGGGGSAYAVEGETGVKGGIKATEASFGEQKDLEGTVTNIINVILYVVGILAVVMIVIGGVQYTTSGGDQAAVTKAKNTILYGIVGLVVAILAYAIVNFVLKQLGILK